MPEKKYKLKTYRQLDAIIDNIDNTRQKKYDIKRLLKRYSDKMNRQVDWIINVEANDEKAMNIKPTNNLHIMYEECKRYRQSYLDFKRKCDRLLTLNAMLEDENNELKEKLAKYESQSTESVN